MLFESHVEDSVSGLARRARLTPRTVAREVEGLNRAGLVTVETKGGADWVRPNWAHPAASPLSALLAVSTVRNPGQDADVREALAAWGAPLAGAWKTKTKTKTKTTKMSLTDTLLRGLKDARHDGTVL